MRVFIESGVFGPFWFDLIWRFNFGRCFLCVLNWNRQNEFWSFLVLKFLQGSGNSPCKILHSTDNRAPLSTTHHHFLPVLKALKCSAWGAAAPNAEHFIVPITALRSQPPTSSSRLLIIFFFNRKIYIIYIIWGDCYPEIGLKRKSHEVKKSTRTRKNAGPNFRGQRGKVRVWSWDRLVSLKIP